MNTHELATLLLSQRKATVLARVANDWVEVWGVCATGQHRNAVTLDTRMPGGGVIVVEPQEEE